MIGTHRLTRHVMIVVLCLSVTLFWSTVASACPTCKDTLAANDSDQANIVRGYFWSILFMMSMPFMILGGLGSYMYVEVRRARGRQTAAALTLGGSNLFILDQSIGRTPAKDFSKI